MLDRRHFIKSSLALGLAGAAPMMAHAAEGFTVTDLKSREVHFAKQPQKIVVANYISNFLMIGGEASIPKITALPLDGWDVTRYAEQRRFTEAFPELNKIPSIGGYHDNILDTEKILALKPDAILVGIAQYNDNQHRLQILQSKGVAVVVLDYHAMTLENHCRSTEILGRLLGRESIAQAQIERYTSIRKTIEERLAKLPESAKHRRVYVECGNEGISTYGNSYNNTVLWGGLLKQVQAQNIAAEMKTPYGALSREFVVSSNPQTIIIAGSIWQNAAQNDQMHMGMMVDEKDAQTRLKRFTTRPLWSRLEAVQKGEVYGVDHGSLRSMMDYVYSMYLAQILYPETFKDYDVEAEIQTFFKTYLPKVDASGTYILKLAK